MPAWICNPVGAGVANNEPGALRVALAGIRPLTLASVPRWQLSQVLLDGMCAAAPIGEVGGITMMRVMPAKLVPVMFDPWQATQLLVMPAWLMREPENFAPLGTGSVGTLEPADVADLAGGAGRDVVGRQADDAEVGRRNGEAKRRVAPWHCAQLVVVLGALAWIAASVGITE